MGTFDNLPHGLKLKKISFTLSSRSAGDDWWKCIGTFEDSSGESWLAFGDGHTLTHCATMCELNAQEGHLRRPKF